MFGVGFGSSPFRQCQECGVPLTAGTHECNPDTVAHWQARHVGSEIREWLDSNQGKFEQFWAQREKK